MYNTHTHTQTYQGVWGEVRLGGGEEDAGKGGEEVGPVLGEAVLAVTLTVCVCVHALRDFSEQTKISRVTDWWWGWRWWH